MLIAGGNLGRGTLEGEVVVVTGAGGGIGFEAARSLLWLGASVAIAEIDVIAGRDAATRLAGEWGDGRVLFVPADIGDEATIAVLCERVVSRFGKIDAVVNNATYAPAGRTVAETPIDVWDQSYAVNLRGPVMLARAVLPGMVARRHGVLAFVSSTGGPFLAPYETLKAAQVALANSIDAELADTGVVAFTIGPGLVPTQTACAAIDVLAPKLGMTVEQFWTVNRGAVLSVEAAGAGFAAAVAQAARYGGQEISSTQALVDAGIEVTSAEPPRARQAAGDTAAAVELCEAVRKTLDDQAAGWRERSFFERQWMQRDFKQRVGMPVERCLETLDHVRRSVAEGDLSPLESEHEMLERLAAFYDHLGQLAQGYVKDPLQRVEQERITAGWKAELDRLLQLRQSSEVLAAAR